MRVSDVLRPRPAVALILIVAPSARADPTHPPPRQP